MPNYKISDSAFLWANEAEKVYTAMFNNHRFYATSRKQLAMKIDKYLRERDLVKDHNASTKNLKGE